MSWAFWISDKHIFTTEKLGTGICLMTLICFRGDKGFAWDQMLGFICIEFSCHSDTFDFVHPHIIPLSLFLCLVIWWVDSPYAYHIQNTLPKYKIILGFLD